MPIQDKEMTLIEHLEELRQRLTYAIVGLLAASGIGLIFVNSILHLLLRPLGGLKLTTLTVLEPFLVKMKIAFLFGIAVSMPWIVYQMFAYINPALTENERRKVVPVALLSGVLFACGVVFAYVFVLPVSTHWLLAQAGGQFNVLITANAYITYILFFLAIVGGTFETPLLILALVALGVVSTATLRKEWRIAYMIIAGISVLGTPDWSPVTMVLVFIPMAALYEFSIILCRVFVRPAVPRPAQTPST